MGTHHGTRPHDAVSLGPDEGRGADKATTQKNLESAVSHGTIQAQRPPSYDSIYMNDPLQVDPGPRDAKGWGALLMDTGCPSGVMECPEFREMMVVRILILCEYKDLKGWILWLVNYISMKLLLFFKNMHTQLGLLIFWKF